MVLFHLETVLKILSYYYMGEKVAYYMKMTLQKNRPVPAFFFPAFLRTAVIDKPIPAFFENAGIGNPITATQNQRFKKRCNRRPITAFLKNAGIGGPKALG